MYIKKKFNFFVSNKDILNLNHFNGNFNFTMNN